MASFRLDADRQASSSVLPSRARRMTMFALKMAVTLGASVWILSLVDWVQFWNTVRSAAHGILVLVFVMRVGGVTLSAYKWQQLLALHGAGFHLARLIRWYLVAMFLNHFLPTSIGGDAFRIYRTLDNVRGRTCAVLAVVIERASGLAALLLVGMIAGIVMMQRGSDPVVTVVLATSAAGLVAAAAAVVLARRLVPLDRLAGHRWGRRLVGVVDLLRDFGGQPRRMVLIGLISFVFHINKIAAAWLVLYALGAAPDPLALALTVVATEVIGLLPISLGGLGVVDGSFIYLLSRFGVAAEPALAGMLLLRVLNLPLALVGGQLYVAKERAPNAAGTGTVAPLIDPATSNR